MELGLTQEELAERVGDAVRQAEISRLEHDKVSLPRRPRLEQLAKALDLPIGLLLSSSGWVGAEHIEAEDSDGTAALAAREEHLETLNADLQETIGELWATREEYRVRAEHLQQEVEHVSTDHERLAASFDGIEDAVVVVDAAGTVLFHNAAWEVVARRHGADFMLVNERGEPIPPPDHPFQRAARGEEFRFDVVMRGGGTTATYTAHGRAIVTETGDRLGVVTIQDCDDDL